MRIRLAHREPQAHCVSVLADRYLAPGERTLEHVFKRVARALARAEEPCARDRFTRLFYGNLLQGAIGAGRIMANAGTANDATMVNCFVHPICAGPDGSRTATADDIERALAAARTTLIMGGGIGYDFSPVPPADAGIDGENAARDACAAVDRFDAACEQAPFAGARRGAQMAVLRCDHPDLPAFVRAKTGRRRWRTFNVSIAVTDAFMRAVGDDRTWMLRHDAAPSARQLRAGAFRLSTGDWCYRVVRARAIWEQITACARDSAEPGLLFIDTVNRTNNLARLETVAATNPCGEQPLPPWGSCVLGPIDLSRIVDAPFGAGGTPRFGFMRLGQLVRVQVRMLDNVLDITRWPLAEHEREASAKRRIGVGVTGLADALAMMRLRYDSHDARQLVGRIARCMRDQAYAASAELAAQRGPFPSFSPDLYLGENRFTSELPAPVRNAIARHGLRNSHLLSLAPTGSVSLAFADNCSSGIEPAYDWVYRRAIRLRNGEPQAAVAQNRAYRLFRSLHGDAAPLPPYFAKGTDVAPADHIAMLATLQPFVDAGISKTVALPQTCTKEEVAELFFDAWKKGLKGITVFRADPALDAVLTPGGEVPASLPPCCPACQESPFPPLPKLAEPR